MRLILDPRRKDDAVEESLRDQRISHDEISITGVKI